MSLLPHNFGPRRDDLHRLAFGVVAQARFDLTERFSLQPTQGGFGTPRFGPDGTTDRQIRVAQGELIITDGDGTRSAPITTLAEAAAFVGTTPGVAAREHDSPELGNVDEVLDVDADLTDFLADWFDLGATALLGTADTEAASDVSPLWLWPGHFDVALEIGDAAAGQRATYGASPGDGAHAEPYLYVGAWGDIDRGDAFWNDDAFAGASRSYSELLTEADLPAAAQAFFEGGLSRLSG